MDDNKNIDVQTLSRCLLDKAKIWWGWAIFLGACIFGVGAASMFFVPWAKTLGGMVIGLTAATYACQLRSCTWQARGDCLRRKQDMEDSFGWKVSNAEYSDLLITLSKRCRAKLESAAKENYFASSQSPGARRALENLQESSWFSKHLARTAGHISLAVILFLVVVSITTLLVSLNGLEDHDLVVNIGRVVTSAIMLVISLDLVSLMLKYYDFSGQSELIEKAANELLQGEQENIVPALKLWQDYHVSRSTGPMIPTWLWLLRRGDLNKIWEQYRK